MRFDEFSPKFNNIERKSTFRGACSTRASLFLFCATAITLQLFLLFAARAAIVFSVPSQELIAPRARLLAPLRLQQLCRSQYTRQADLKYGFEYSASKDARRNERRILPARETFALPRLLSTEFVIRSTGARRDPAEFERYRPKFQEKGCQI